MTKEEQREYNRKYYQANREKRLEQMKEWQEANREKLTEYNKEYYQTNKEKKKEYRQSNSKNKKEYDREYRKTPMGRASHLLSAYNRNDKKYNRGKGDLTAQWIVENIFTKKCVYCGKEGWEVIGCNRIDNDKPHSKDNVEPCCLEHNLKLPRKRKKGDN